MAWLGGLLSRSWLAGVAALAALYLAWPCSFDPACVSMKLPPSLEGVYHPQHCKASRAGRKVVEIPGIVGAESLVFDSKGTMYAGSINGIVWKIESLDRPPTILARTGSRECGPDEEDEECGRPLGLRMLNDSTLVAVDLHAGLLAISTATGCVETLLPVGVLVDDEPVMVLNDLDVRDRQVYVSQMTSKWSAADLDYEFVEAQCIGRILRYDVDKNTTEKVVDQLCFPNGLQLSADGSRVVFSESSRMQVSVFDLRPSAGASEKATFDDNAAGLPDNIRRHPEGGYLVAMPSLRDRQLELTMGWPRVRWLLWKLTPKAVYRMVDASVQYGMCVHYHDNGTVLESYHFNEYKHVGFDSVSQCTVAPDNRTLIVTSRSRPGMIVTPLK